ncbi:unnamed protein product [Trichogramma brassicae]|uniref:Uncharacterized protein n=1 Tax=Trichogramma brassicae TaxID=86971 RepID=A0A6H5IV42_9HYME|nr:unnamed protein product [Trichogramma brassicae]
MLLQNGADPNSANKDGSTPLHIICKMESSNLDDTPDQFFKIVDEHHLTVQIDARDNLGRTPLQWAVASLLPNVVDLLLDRGADLSSFVFPTESYYGEIYGPLNEHYDEFAISLAANALITLERLEKRGYKFYRSDALTIMKFIDKFGALFDMPTNFSKRWYKNKKFAKEAKKHMIIDEKHQTLQIDALDKLGRTPLQLAVASHLPEAVESIIMLSGKNEARQVSAAIQECIDNIRLEICHGQLQRCRAYSTLDVDSHRLLDVVADFEEFVHQVIVASSRADNVQRSQALGIE